jgi:hypothetical protein
MSDSSALTPPRRPGPPATLEERALLRAHVAAYHDDAPTPQHADSEVVVVTGEDGGVTVYPASEKLVILAAWRERKKQ